MVQERTEGKYDRILFSHGNVEESAIDIMENVLEICHKVHQGEVAGIPFMFIDGQKGFIAKEVNHAMEDADGKFENIVFDFEKL